MQIGIQKGKEKIFSFKFKNKKHPEIEYNAVYTPNNKLKIKTNKPRNFKPTNSGYIFYIKYYDNIRSVEGKNWYCFKENASFEEILEAIKYDRTQLSDKVINLKKIPVIKKDPQLLEMIRDIPSLLENPILRQKFINIIERANYGSNEDRRELKHILKSHFIPIHKGGKKLLPSLKAPLDLLKKLAKYLSRSCKYELVNTPITHLESADEILSRYPIDSTKHLLEDWGPQRENRICNLNSEDLRVLIKNPSQFAEKLLAKYLEVSIRTIKRRLEKETKK